jgi:hypothetical protein
MNVHFDLTCPRCGSDLDAVANDDPQGWTTRERRLVVTCLRPACSWGGVVVTELIDLTHRRTA